MDSKRIFVGFLVAAVALAAAVWVYSGWKPRSVSHWEAGSEAGSWTTPGFAYYTHASFSWQNPLAAFIAIAGIGAGAAVVLPALRRRA
jgi:hypothetical protein